MIKMNLNSRMLVAKIFGLFGALGSLPHGLGLMLQGNKKPTGIIINTWASGPIAENLGGEPGMTVIPNLWVSGLLTILISLAMILWVILKMHKKNGGAIYIVLTLAVLLTGGGFAPPIISLLAGITAISAQSKSKTEIEPNSKYGKVIIRIWPIIFGLSLLIGVFVFVLGIVLSALDLINVPQLFVYGFFTLIITINFLNITGYKFDQYKRTFNSIHFEDKVHLKTL